MALIVKKETSDQHTIENTSEDRQGDFDRKYFCVGGFFGEYGPDMFAAAPDMLDALRECVAMITDVENKYGSTFKCAVASRAAIAKAEGNK